MEHDGGPRFFVLAVNVRGFGCPFLQNGSYAFSHGTKVRMWSCLAKLYLRRDFIPFLSRSVIF